MKYQTINGEKVYIPTDCTAEKYEQPDQVDPRSCHTCSKCHVCVYRDELMGTRFVRGNSRKKADEFLRYIAKICPNYSELDI